MVLAPGGENQRPELDPSKRSIGIRIRRAAGAASEIERLRARFYPHETRKVLGIRRPSTRMKNAFGARHFQPHISVIRPGSPIAGSLSSLGEALRGTIGELKLDRLVVRCRHRVE